MIYSIVTDNAEIRKFGVPVRDGLCTVDALLPCKQSAALRIHTTETYPSLDLRVDDHPEPLTELRRLHEVSKEIFQPFLAFLPSQMNPAGIYDRAVIDAELARRQAARKG